jgi:hypothetical protein
MNTFVKILAAVAMLSSATMGSAQSEVRFTGETTADEALIDDVMRNLVSYIHDSLRCENVELVEAKVLPAESIERDPADPEGKNPATYERWDARYCGTSKSFLVVFWASKQGGTMFRIQLRPAE